MARPTPDDFGIDPADPRAPTQAAWDHLTPDERERLVERLPTAPEPAPCEGDLHDDACASARRTLDAFFRGSGRKVYVSGGMNVYYPGERPVAPDVFAVLDVATCPRRRWVVSYEGKGLDLALEVHAERRRTEDYRVNVVRYARLGIFEYFVYDCLKRSLIGFRLPPPGPGAARAYAPIPSQAGRFASEVLGLTLAVDGTKLRFLRGDAPLLDAEEQIATLARRAESAERRVEALERELAGLRAELARLRPRDA